MILSVNFFFGPFEVSRQFYGKLKNYAISYPFFPGILMDLFCLLHLMVGAGCSQYSLLQFDIVFHCCFHFVENEWFSPSWKGVFKLDLPATGCDTAKNSNN